MSRWQVQLLQANEWNQGQSKAVGQCESSTAMPAGQDSPAGPSATMDGQRDIWQPSCALPWFTSPGQSHRRDVRHIVQNGRLWTMPLRRKSYISDAAQARTLDWPQAAQRLRTRYVMGSGHRCSLGCWPGAAGLGRAISALWSGLVQWGQSSRLWTRPPPWTGSGWTMC